MPVLEAAYFGKPAVALDYAGAREAILHQKTGFVVKNQKQLYNYLKKLIEDSNLRLKLGQNAKKWSQNFSWQTAADNWSKVLLDCQKSKR